MTPSEPHETDQLVRYAENDLPLAERAAVAQHLGTCAPCQEFLSFVKEFTAALREAQPRSAVLTEACPDASLIVELAAGELDERIAEHVRAHVAFCSSCLEELFLLQHVKTAEQPEEAAWQKLLERLRECLIDLGKTYGPGIVLGPARIVAETPEFATRGGEAPERVFKVIELSVGENTYSVELGLAPDGAVHCDVAGVATSAEIPLTVEVRSTTGEILSREETDVHGNMAFALSRKQLSDDLCVFTFLLADRQSGVLVQLPATASPAAPR